MKVYFIKLGFYLFLGFFLLKASAFQPLVGEFCLWLAKIVEWILVPFDSNIFRDGRTIVWKTYGYAVLIDNVCSALTFVVGIWAAILAFPVGIVWRLISIVFVFLVIEFFNLFRIILVIYSNVVMEKHIFHIFHEYFLPLLIGFLVIALFAWWVDKVRLAESGLNKEGCDDL